MYYRYDCKVIHSFCQLESLSVQSVSTFTPLSHYYLLQLNCVYMEEYTVTLLFLHLKCINHFFFFCLFKGSTTNCSNATQLCDDTAAQIYPSHPGDRITCSPPPSVTQLGGGCLKAVTLTHSSILPNHPPTVPHSRGEQERGRGRQTEGEAANK